MLIRMYENKAIQDAGVERPLRVGQTYDVSPVLGAHWVGAGVAVEVAPAPEPAQKREHKGRARA
jgi:hypothetical protein